MMEFFFNLKKLLFSKFFKMYPCINVYKGSLKSASGELFLGTPMDSLLLLVKIQKELQEKQLKGVLENRCSGNSKSQRR